MQKQPPRRAAQTLALSALLGCVVAAALVTTGIAQTAPPVQVPTSQSPQPAGGLTGTWKWLRSDYSDDSSVVAADPNRYTADFQTDGTLSIRADCNQVIGSYRALDSHITILLGPTTLVGCPADSQADVFLRDLGNVQTYVFSGQNLVLNIKFSTGNMIFER